MVKMRPDFYPADTVKGEKLVFNKLKGLEGADAWIALHSLDIFGDIPSGQGEADMVVLIPGKGVLVIEVKTHTQVECDEGVWRLNGKIFERPPHKQASNAMHAIRAELERSGVDLYKMPFGFCVWFTGANKIAVPKSPEFKQWMFLFAEDLNGDLKKTFGNILDNWAEHRKLPKGGESAGVATVSALNEVATGLRPEVKIRKSAEQRVKELNESLEAALAQQLELMHLISGRKQVSIIPGMAGTGKTHIAIAEAKKAHQRGDRTLFICYNKLLGNFLKAELADFALVEVYTISSYMLKVAGLSFQPDKASDWWQSELPLLAQNAIIESDKLDRFDVLIVDESQDICLDSYLDVLDLSLEKGLAGSQVMFFGDFTHQAIYMPGDIALSNLKKKVPGAIDYQLLDINCRNTKQIGETVMQIMGEQGAYSSYRRSDAGIQPKLFSLKPGESALKILKDQVSRLEKQFSLEHIVVLSSNKEKLSNLLEQSGIAMTALDRPTGGKLRWGTTQSFKGMEAPAVILVEFEDGLAASRETFYIAGTRAIAELVCIVPVSIANALTQKD
jgi:hypothetical protein